MVNQLLLLLVLLVLLVLELEDGGASGRKPKPNARRGDAYKAPLLLRRRDGDAVGTDAILVLKCADIQ